MLHPNRRSRYTVEIVSRHTEIYFNKPYTVEGCQLFLLTDCHQWSQKGSKVEYSVGVRVLLVLYGWMSHYYKVKAPLRFYRLPDLLI